MNRLRRFIIYLSLLIRLLLSNEYVALVINRKARPKRRSRSINLSIIRRVKHF